MGWHTEHTVIYEDDAIRLIQFKTGEGTPILIVPPQAGHKSYIADYGDGQSLVQVAMEGTASVYCIDWKSCTHDRRNETIDDLIWQVRIASLCIESTPHIVGLCQGGWLAAIYATRFHLEELTIAGAPLDTSVGESILQQAIDTPLSTYKFIVNSGGGLVHGWWMLACWKAPNWQKHYIDRYLNYSEKQEKFYRWYDATQEIAGGWYLECIDRLFQKNQLIKGEMGNLKNIKCPVNLIAGEKDDITPKEQTFALGGDQRVLIPGAGHIGLFMGHDSMKYWRKVLIK